MQVEVDFPAILHIPPSCMSADLLASLRQRQHSMSPCADESSATTTAKSMRCDSNDDDDCSSGSDDDSDSRDVITSQSKSREKAGRPLLTYKLQGVILHHGNCAESGHYTCFCLDNNGGLPGTQDNMWRHVDDTSITKVSTAQVLAAKKLVRNDWNQSLCLLVMICQYMVLSAVAVNVVCV